MSYRRFTDWESELDVQVGTGAYVITPRAGVARGVEVLRAALSSSGDF
ncbi:hypothetical protein [Paenibacillus massiliensis]|nr:hypothetical protein [Paenibacillus massiliensis]